MRMKQEKNVIEAGIFVRKHKLDTMLLGLSVLLGVLFDWNIVEIGIFTFFILVILGYVSLRTIGMFALFFLSFAPILFLLDREKRAEEFAVYAYYFLVMAVIRGIVELREDKDAPVSHK